MYGDCTLSSTQVTVGQHWRSAPRAVRALGRAWVRAAAAVHGLPYCGWDSIVQTITRSATKPALSPPK